MVHVGSSPMTRTYMNEIQIPIASMGARVRSALEAAKEAAKNSSAPCFRHGAVLFSGAAHYGIGYNDYRAVAWAWKSDRTIPPELISGLRQNNMHAEIACMHNVPRELITNSDIMVVRIDKTGTLCLSKPCSNCQRNMREKKIRRCYYSIDERTIGRFDV